MTTIYDILRRPLVTEKTNYQHTRLHQYAFEVADNATRTMVKDAVEKIFDVTVLRVNIINVPAGTWVYKTSVRVLKANTGSSTRTFTVGDSADDDGYVAAMTAKTVAHAVGAGAFAAGKFYATASTIDLTSVEALDDGVVEFRALAFAL